MSYAIEAVAIEPMKCQFCTRWEPFGHTQITAGLSIRRGDRFHVRVATWPWGSGLAVVCQRCFPVVVHVRHVVGLAQVTPASIRRWEPKTHDEKVVKLQWAHLWKDGDGLCPVPRIASVGESIGEIPVLLQGAK